MAGYSPAIQKAIEALSKLPGIGPKTAERLVFYILQTKKQLSSELSQALAGLTDGIEHCSHCYNFSEINPCEICSDAKRNPRVVCVVSKPQDVIALEKVNQYEGQYHVLGGVIDPLNDITPDTLSFAQLSQRINKDRVQELILALNPDISGETTMLYINTTYKGKSIKITRLARGLPIGSELEYADEVTLGSALLNRKEFS